MVEAWLTGGELPHDLVPEVVSQAALARLRRELGGDAADAWAGAGPTQAGTPQAGGVGVSA
jgi:hypothetical protein